MIDIKSFAKPKATSSVASAGTSSAGGTINISDERIAEIVEGIVASSIQNITIVNGDNTLEITKTGDGTSVNFTINSLTWTFDASTGHLKYLGAIDTNSINTSSITSTQGNITTFTSGNATITTLTGDNLTFDTGEIDDLSGDTINYKDCTLETLTVTKAAHFFELIIDQIKSTQGQIIITPANAKFDLVEEYTDYYRCYWKYEDEDKQIGNQFSANDQVVCQTFNVTTGTTHDAANKYYWALVVNTGSYELDGENYHYIDISKTDKDTSSNGVPEAGDEIAQLGNRNMTDRQAAIIISAYNNQFLDATVQAPSIVQYEGINNYNLSSHRTNVISKGFNQFKGKFSTNSGDDIEDYLNTFEQSANASISSLTNRMGTAESNITQTQTSIQTEVIARINGDKKYFPILKPWYDYEYNLITDYVNDPLRYEGDADIYSTPTYLEPGTYKVRIFVNEPTLGDSYAICYHGNQYPDDLGGYDPIENFSLGATGKQIIAKDGTTLYEYTGEVTISGNGYYGLNWWERKYIYVPEESNEFESNYSRITQTNNRITTEVGNINGQISTINQTAEDIQLQVNETSIRLNNGDITLTGNTQIQGDLTISDATNGFTITNESNYNTVIKPQSIGNYDDYASREITTRKFIGTSSNDLVTDNIKSKEQHPADTEYFEVRFNNNPDNYTIYLEAGTVLNLNTFDNFGLFNGGRYNYVHPTYGKFDYCSIGGEYTPSTSNYDSRVYITGYKQYGSQTISAELISVHIYSIQTRISILDANNTEVGYTVLNGNTPTLNYNFTATATGNYKIKTAVLIRFNSIYNYTGERADNVFTNYVDNVVIINVKTTLSSNQIENIIGYDGIALSLGANNTVYMGKDNTIIGYGNSKLMINGNGMFKYAGSTTPQYQSESIMGTETGLSKYAAEWVKINGCVVRQIVQSGTFYLQPRDEVISYGGASQDSYLWINRPSQEVGRKIYVKPTGERTNIIIGTYDGDTEKYFMQSYGRGTYNRITIGDRGITLISDGWYWWMYYVY